VISGSTRVFALLGDPVAHSLSPTMQNAAFRALGLEAAYVPLRCRAGDLPDLLRVLVRAEGGGNVTVPHKEAAARAVQRGSDQVTALGACNTFWGEDGVIAGENTDVAGLVEALDRLDAPEGPWLVFGTGGGARAAVGAALRRGVGLAITSRSPDRRQAFVDWVGSLGGTIVPPESCRVVINATPLGLHFDDPLPPPPPRGVEVALDMVYARGETQWVRAMRTKGLRASDGRAMLVGQGAAAFERWFPGVGAPTEIMRAAVDAALR